MDDTRTRETLDTLADLFLTGIAPENLPGSASVSPPNSPGSAPAPDASSSLAGVSSGLLDPLVGPPPIRLAPKPAGDSAMPMTPVDPAPPLKLARFEDEQPMDENVAPEPDQGPVHATVEAVVLGNLPGLAGPWLTQYAQLLSQQEGPVAILHVGEGNVDLELIEPADPQPSHQSPGPHVSTRMPPNGDQGDLIAVLDHLARDPHHPVRTLLVRLDPDNDPDDVARILAFDYWTLATGTDDAAVVAAYALLKSLHQAHAQVATRQVGVMMMGSDQATSESAAQRISQASQSFLETPVQLVGWQQKMVPVHIRQLGSFAPLDTLWPRLLHWMRQLEEPAPAPESHPEAASQNHTPSLASTPSHAPPAWLGSPPPESVTPERDVDLDMDLGVETAVAVETLEDDTTPAPGQRASETDAEDALEAPAASAQASEPQAPALADLLGELLPGAVALEARCPHDPQIEIMLDQAGVLHLLHRVDPQDSRSPQAVHSTILNLLATRQWAQDHQQVLALTQRQCQFDTHTQPTLHLFTDRADLATPLTARLGAMVRLHLLQPISLADEDAWLCTPLS